MDDERREPAAVDPPATPRPPSPGRRSPGRRSTGRLSTGRLWHRLRAVLAVLGLGLPLVPVFFLRHREAIAALLVALAVVGVAFGRRRPRLLRAALVAYLVAAAALAWRSREIVTAAAPDAWPRIALTAAALVLLTLGRRRFAPAPAEGEPPRPDGPGPGRNPLGWDLALVAAAAVVVGLGQPRAWANPSVLSALLLVSPGLQLRPGVVPLAVGLVCAVAGLYQWHGFAYTRYREAPAVRAGDGVEVALLQHGEPRAFPGARIFDRGRCPSTRDAHYVGEARRTYRLHADGTEVDLVSAAEGEPSLCSVVELCERGEVVTGSEEGRFLRFADLETGEPLEDVPLQGMPTFVLPAPGGERLYVSTIRPGSLVRVDVASRRVDRVLTRYLDVDPTSSGVNNLAWAGDRIVAAFSSYFAVDGGGGEVFSVDEDLGDFRSLWPLEGIYAAVAPGAADHVFLKVYTGSTLWRVATDGSGAEPVAPVPPGFHFMARLREPSAVVVNHWASGEMVAICTEPPHRVVAIELGGMGRPMQVRDSSVLTPVAAGYATVTFPPDLCPPTAAAAAR